jgi:UDP-N-acetylglucosamine 2-epimerase
MKKILVVFGTRPEAIKMAPLVKQLKSSPAFSTALCVSGQHREMLDQVLEIFDLVPDFDLNVMKANQDLTSLTSSILAGMRGVLKKYQPDLVIVHGDTATSYVTALAAFYQQIDVAHVEAGLRTGNLYAPWPEEAYRRLTGVLTKLHFAPTEQARQNLMGEGVAGDQIVVTGNTVIDALKQVVKKIETEPRLQAELRDLFPYLSDKRRMILITGHRRESFGQGFINICEAIKTLSDRFTDCDFVYPVHLNPNVQEPVTRLLGDLGNVHLSEPLSYLPFVYLMNRACLLLTDSGGIQEEAPSLGKPVLVMRETTERPEALAAGTVKLVGADEAKIVAGVAQLLTDKDTYTQMSRALNPYGDGSACQRICAVLEERSVNAV